MVSDSIASEGKTGLVLTGGGARAAYQVGVLSAIRDMLADRDTNPFPIISGTSAGAINAAALAAKCENFDRAVNDLISVWEGFKPSDIYRSDFPGVAKNSLSWLYAFFFGAFAKRRRVSLFDNTPLESLLAEKIDYQSIQKAIDSRALEALAITCSGYTSGQSCSFFQGAPHVEGWRRAQRVGIKCAISPAHLLASSAIPFIFPAVKLNREFFGDGSMRQMAPVSPALHLGARRVVVIATAKIKTKLPDRAHTKSDAYPTLAEIAGHAMRSIFLDNLALDIELLERLNQTVSLIETQRLAQAGLALRHVDVLVITPSQPLDDLAPQYVQHLPRPIRFLLRSIGAMRKGGAHLASYLLFEENYCKRLIKLGYEDAMNRQDEIEAFMQGAYCPVPGAFAKTVILHPKKPATSGERSPV